MRSAATGLITAVAASTIAATALAAAPVPPLVSQAWLAAHRADPHVVVLDLRPAEQYAAGHVPGAVMADYEHTGWRVTLPDGAGGALPPVPQIAATIGRLGVTDADDVVLVADDFAAAARIFWTFHVLGDKNVSILDGGWNAWQQAHAPAQTVPNVPHPAVFIAHYDPSLRAELPEVAKAVRTGDETLVDARPPKQWNGSAKTPVVAEYGHLPHAVWIDQTSAISPDGKLKPRAQLAALFAKVGDKPATTYCNTGHLAATDWFVLTEVLHHPNTKLYDGSMSEWTHDPARPVAR